MASCSDCHYMFEEDDVFICRRYPPQIYWAGIVAESSTPEVEADWWCGEHAPKGGYH
jgi:hypothetical protein